MAGEYRVVTTDVLRAMHSETGGELVVAAGLVDRLDPDGFHVLVPRGHVHGPGENRLVCGVQLAIAGQKAATEVDVVVSVETFEDLPAAFDVLRAAASLVPSTVDAVDTELIRLIASTEEGL